jgi:hypothetical protein
MEQLQANPGVPKLAQFWRDPAFVVISHQSSPCVYMGNERAQL